MANYKQPLWCTVDYFASLLLMEKLPQAQNEMWLWKAQRFICFDLHGILIGWFTLEVNRLFWLAVELKIKDNFGFFSTGRGCLLVIGKAKMMALFQYPSAKMLVAALHNNGLLPSKAILNFIKWMSTANEDSNFLQKGLTFNSSMKNCTFWEQFSLERIF